jgi:hypothetical protein
VLKVGGCDTDMSEEIKKPVRVWCDGWYDTLLNIT